MKSFLGLANWFRDNVRNFSQTAGPLHEGIKDYKRKAPFKWTTETKIAFNQLKQLISESQMLFYPDKDWPIHLHTDASDYGIGAFLFQEREGVKRPIAFMSAKLTDTQKKWNTLEKECYAIVKALHKFDYLLMDVKFTIRTDHRNLTFLNQGLSSKVLRWKLMIQEYDFVLEHLPGEQNVQADAFSRADFNHIRVVRQNNLSQLMTGKIKDSPIPDHILTLIEESHNDFIGHHGVARTIQAVQRQCHKMTTANQPIPEDTKQIPEYCRQFVQNCVKCQLFSQIKPLIQTKRFTCSAHKPMQDIAIDTIGPFQMDSAGNKYVLVIIDTFSRWIQLSAVTDVSALTAAKQLINFLGTFGNPNSIRSDQGTEFINELWKNLHQLAGIKEIVNHPYSKEENGIVERANKEITKHLRNFLFGNPTIKESWSSVIPLVQRIYNNSPNQSIGNIRPCQIIFGNAIDLDGEIFPGDNKTQLQQIATMINMDYKQYLSFLIKNQQIIIQEALNAQIINDNKHYTRPTKGNKVEYSIGQYVLVNRYPPHTDWTNKPKLTTRWLGPYLVINKNDDWYTLKNLVTNTRNRFIFYK